MQKITPHLWYDKEAKEAAEFYVAAFGENSKIKDVITINDTPSGSTYIVSFDILGQEFMAIKAGPFFKINPSTLVFRKWGLKRGASNPNSSPCEPDSLVTGWQMRRD